MSAMHFIVSVPSFLGNFFLFIAHLPDILSDIGVRKKNCKTGFPKNLAYQAIQHIIIINTKSLDKVSAEQILTQFFAHRRIVIVSSRTNLFYELN